ncbi:glycosyl transferase family 1 [Marmoricola endophyticus]|uniref:Glycosyl transferase family 1 n=1 Tax=Marmoricola endophyticus TaxID=2040280 RepID=A0A917BLX7_9ACTN|nr:glycosyltransferase family 4 protein [Marmoricola endophyticus]GGF48789.1 glycosyl transferase family 1 [Marmoricola endophyticus]
MSARRPKILQVVHRFLPETGGTETHVAEVSARLAERGEFDVTVLTTDRSAELPAAERIDGYDVLRRRAWPRDRDYYVSPGLARVVSSGDWDLVHVQGVHTLVAPTAMAAATASRTPFVLTFHSGGAVSSARAATRTAHWRLIAPLVRRAEQLIAVSRFEVGHFAEPLGVDPSRMRVIRNGGALPAPVGPIDPVPGRIVSSGRLEEYKGHQLAVRAMPHVRARLPGAELVILGVGPYESTLRGLVTALGLDDAVSIRHLPPGDRAAMTRELSQASVMASMSTYEAHPVGVMEALTLGLPVVGLDVAGTGDLVEEGLVTGVPVGVTDRELAQVLAAELEATESRGGPHRPRPVGLPTWDETVDQLSEIYREVLARRRS